MMWVAKDGKTDHRFTFEEMKKYTSMTANYFESLGIKHTALSPQVSLRSLSPVTATRHPKPRKQLRMQVWISPSLWPTVPMTKQV